MTTNNIAKKKSDAILKLKIFPIPYLNIKKNYIGNIEYDMEYNNKPYTDADQVDHYLNQILNEPKPFVHYTKEITFDANSKPQQTESITGGKKRRRKRNTRKRNSKKRKTRKQTK